MSSTPKSVTARDILPHNTPSDCWIVVDNQVWDVTEFIDEHPGGPAIILKYAGKDATEAYSEVHSPPLIRENLAHTQFKGRLDLSSLIPEWEAANSPPSPPPTVARMTSKTTSKAVVTTQEEEMEKPPLSDIINLHDFEEAASKHGPKKAYAFYSTASTDCWTRDTDPEILKRIWFRPRVMRNVRDIDLSTSFYSGQQQVTLPLIMCPFGLVKLIHSEGEKVLARTAKKEGVPMVVSSGAGWSLDDIVASAQETEGNWPFGFQLYLNTDRSKSRAALLKAKSLGCKAVFLTVDAAGRGKRESDERLKSDVEVVNPVTGEKISAGGAGKKDGIGGGGLTRLMGRYIDQGMVWEDLHWVRDVLDSEQGGNKEGKKERVKLILKGIQTAEDAMTAVETGCVDGIMLSNHGGRNLDYAPPTMLLLLEMHKRCPWVFKQVEVYVDGGFRRGGDIIKALCLGAKGVGIGRSWLYSLLYDSDGVEKVVEILRDEMESVMKLIGARTIADLHPGLVNTSAVDALVPGGDGHPYANWPPKPAL